MGYSNSKANNEKKMSDITPVSAAALRNDAVAADAQVDCAVLGGGLAGIACALALSYADPSLVLVGT